MHEKQALGGRLLTKPFWVLLGLAMIAGLLLIKRFLFGIGAVTNLSDGYPWGIWIVYDVLVGTALGCGGYSIALLVYIFNKGEYHPLVRSALMTSAFGYTLAGVSIFIDIGRYWQMYNVFLPWHINLNSIMFEVAACIGAYVFVLWIEFSPTFLEHRKSLETKKKLSKVLFLFIALGVLLPTMHQSSLGSLMIIAGEKLSPMWQTGWLPLLFLMTAITMGYAVVIFESLFSAVALKRPLDETPILGKLSVMMIPLLVLFLLLRFGDLMWRGQLGNIFNDGMLGAFFIVENVLFLIPIIMLASAKNRMKPTILFWSAGSMILAGALYRFDTFLVAFNPGVGYHYFPSASEILITVGIISIEIMAYLIFVKKLPVLPAIKHS
ncbi:MAG: Ni/Fe-hydrogenase cytochrome b subunit [FCB group bacterium]|nr:Ni/Fe-hydrogenase cytochrome b subunit [FCB group bacterium]MBL7027841.1 Ni/Fe-hydrogenase cytochrome b subunit [Candidatus Neomarinimicrobiota bacterium]MBL7120922.1 Ni/Fe-hydrogenase cytochrome b subunit [Candidatus Neomarinimicrobiota bacterium]